MTAKEWREANPKLEGNVRDHADVTHLVCLANLENLSGIYSSKVWLKVKD